MGESEESAELDERLRRKRNVRDLVAVFVLSVTAVLTAWCGFESSKWSGEMSIAFSQASSSRIQATSYTSKARDARQLDVTIYAAWVAANSNNDTESARYIQDRFTPAFATAFDAWIENGRSETTPFARPDYVVEGAAKADELSADADAQFDVAVAFNQRSDSYSQLTVHFALVLFLVAMSKGQISDRSSRILLILGCAVGVVGTILMFTLPVSL